MFSTDVLEQTTVIGQAVSVGIAFIFRRMHNPLSLPLMLPTPSNLSFKRARQVLDRVVYAIIDARLQTGEQHHDLLDMLISARDADTGQGMSREQLRDEVVTIFLAGHETTANGLTWAWYLLSQHPAHLHALQHEVDTVLQGRPPTIDDLKNLPRRVAQNTPLGGYDLAAGSQVMVNIYGIHHHPDLWEEPEAFKPERFLPGMSLEHQKLAYMPFGAGQHKCIGSNFALVEAQLLLALIAQHYELRLAPDQRIEEELGITLRPRSGMRMTLHPRA
jgi:cytochrome P450